jgi:hypothetical protein
VPRAIGSGLLVGVFVIVPVVQPLSGGTDRDPVPRQCALTTVTTFLSNPVTTPLIVIVSLWIASGLFGMETDPGSVMKMVHAGAGFAGVEALAAVVGGARAADRIVHAVDRHRAGGAMSPARSVGGCGSAISGAIVAGCARRRFDAAADR